MDDLVAFLNARLADDERPVVTARMRREITAKRARLTYYQEAQAKLDRIVAHPGEMSAGDEGMWLGKTAAARMACRYDAAIWDRHSDYRAEWKP